MKKQGNSTLIFFVKRTEKANFVFRMNSNRFPMGNALLRLIVVGFITFAVFQSCSSNKKPVSAEITDIVESVYASATIKAADQYTIVTPVSGVLLQILVHEGDSVSEGQVIARIENANPLLSAENARLALEQARNNKAGLDELRSQLIKQLPGNFRWIRSITNDRDNCGVKTLVQKPSWRHVNLHALHHLINSQPCNRVTGQPGSSTIWPSDRLKTICRSVAKTAVILM